MLTRQTVEQPSRIRARERCLLVRTSRGGDEYRTKQKKNRTGFVRLDAPHIRSNACSSSSTASNELRPTESTFHQDSARGEQGSDGQYG